MDAAARARQSYAMITPLCVGCNPMIDLSEMAEYVDNALAEDVPCLVATASSEGRPNIAFKGSVMVWDRDHLAFWERGNGETLAALRANPQVALIYRNRAKDRAWRFYGEAELYDSGSLRDQVMARTIEAELARDPQRTGVAVVVRIDRVLARGVDMRRES